MQAHSFGVIWPWNLKLVFLGSFFAVYTKHSVIIKQAIKTIFPLSMSPSLTHSFIIRVGSICWSKATVHLCSSRHNDMDSLGITICRLRECVGWIFHEEAALTCDKEDCTQCFSGRHRLYVVGVCYMLGLTTKGDILNSVWRSWRVAFPRVLPQDIMNIFCHQFGKAPIKSLFLTKLGHSKKLPWTLDIFFTSDKTSFLDSRLKVQVWVKALNFAQNGSTCILLKHERSKMITEIDRGALLTLRWIL